MITLLGVTSIVNRWTKTKIKNLINTNFTVLQAHNVFSALSSENYSKVMNYLKHSILSTDLSAYFQ